MLRYLCCPLLGTVLAVPLMAQELAAPAQPQQMVLAVAPSENSPKAKLRLFSRDASGNWKPDGPAWDINLGGRGLAWGIGLHPRQSGRSKQEGDGCTPAGVFRIGKVLGNTPTAPEGNKGWPYHQKTENDAWPEDPQNKFYNQLYTLPAGYRPAWYDKAKLDLTDPAFFYLVVIDHNRERNSLEEKPTSTPGRGSAIFLHTERRKPNGQVLPSTGCPTMPRERLVEVIKWLEPGSGAQFAVLPLDDYKAKWQEWGLPSPDTFRR